MRTRRGRLTGLVLFLALFTALSVVSINPAAGQSAVAGQPNGRLSVLDVPFISQSELLCGGAAAAMVLRYWGERELAAESFAHLVDRSRGGIATPALIGELTQRGWRAAPIAGSDARLLAEMAAGRPVIALIEDRRDTFHYVVVVAVSTAAVVFHDPATRPFRVLSRDRFLQRWNPAGRWMAVVLPPVTSPTSVTTPSLDTPPLSALGSPVDRCEALVADGVRQAQAKDLESAERTLTSALACPGPAPLRELAGVRVLQNRWPDATDLAAAAVRQDAGDQFAWRLLATGLFLQNDFGSALAAWNAAGEPQVDLVGAAGLTRTRSRVVERGLGLAVGDVLTPAALRRGERLLTEIPSVVSASLRYVPVPAGRVEVRAHVVERPLVPSTPINWATLGISAAVVKEIKVGTGSLFGGGERVSGEWRFWPGRPRVAVDVSAPTGWAAVPGTWGAALSQERQPFDSVAVPTSKRLTGRVFLSSWATSGLRWAVRGGVDEWDGRGRFAALGGGLRLASGADRVVGQVDLDGWSGRAGFTTVNAMARVRSSNAREGFSLVGTVGAGLASASTPGDLWLGGDTGLARPILLRAHPLVDDGRMRVGRLGRAAVYGMAEAQRWWRVRSARVGGAVFVDAAHLRRRLEAGPLGDVDVGAGLRASAPGMTGVVRIDLARGLRDGHMRVSFVYEP